MWWTYTMVRDFWEAVACTLTAVLKHTIKPRPLSFLLGLPIKTLKATESGDIYNDSSIKNGKINSLNQQTLTIKVKWNTFMETIRAHQKNKRYDKKLLWVP
ncbi:hypothetical protein XELAEV_18012748mg [Xenopus laevis]|uniref:Uncharacterized protein n=1 Tax=Xenopus laevis TaxID=8355 RepID=A0A974DPC8_XENLA|nr:hypothetical protein XELAEV_18012748mg [Xenopus laevis]